MKFTAHCKRRIAERGISKTQIQRAITNPTYVFYDMSSAANVVFKRLNGQHLLVVYAQEGDDVRVITTFNTSIAQEIIESKLKNGHMGETKMKVEYDRKADILYIK